MTVISSNRGHGGSHLILITNDQEQTLYMLRLTFLGIFLPSLSKVTSTLTEYLFNSVHMSNQRNETSNNTFDLVRMKFSVTSEK